MLMSLEKKNTKSIVVYPVIVISLAACFLFYKYVLQIFPSIITEPLMKQFHLTGTGLGNLAATFYYSYTVTQLFVGILLDKYGTRQFTSIAIFCCAFGVLLFSTAETLSVAVIARALMGVGVAFATVSYMKLAADWFSPKQYAFVSGLLATAAMAGAVFGQAPLAWFIAHFGWRQCLFSVGVSGVILSCLFFMVVRDRPSALRMTITRAPISFKEVLQVIKSKQNWLLTLYSGLAFSPIAVFGGLWGNPFLEEAYHLSKTQSASLISLVFVGLGLGSPILGLLSDRLGKRQYVMLFSTLASTAALTLVLYCHTLSLTALSVLLFLFGFGLGSFMLVFAMGKEINSVALTATVIAMINTSDAIFDALTEPLIGKLLDMGWEGGIVNGVHQFSLSSYHLALSLLPIYLIVGSLLLLWVKEPIKET
ncbi:major facilitator family transporter (Permease) [Legionella gratiana]|uniref:Lysosomal dipeptide transporter MFSD1 n=1 Tax=Legionella gratiana TaxID=45066 RepID=A0A378JF50_9GAMM|nr:MFS transporter [Legionella gratiana]KTD06677.1 major facilitator family transporter (Permease) [Legionella gratiana]STX46245.1 major facilitator family transporter (Permease) [Legionella gratiana]